MGTWSLKEKAIARSSVAQAVKQLLRIEALRHVSVLS